MNARKVLLIEDDAGIARIVQRGLALVDVAVTVADNGASGRACWTTGAYDLVLLDVMLPGIDGIDLCAERRRAGDQTPVLLLTARDEGEVWARGQAAGATAYIGKPFAYARLAELVLRLLRDSPELGVGET